MYFLFLSAEVSSVCTNPYQSCNQNWGLSNEFIEKLTLSSRSSILQDNLIESGYLNSELKPTLPMEKDKLQYHGTTTISFIFKSGIIVAVDSRASIGDYVGSRTVKKVIPITSNIGICAYTYINLLFCEYINCI
jgi:hypothetical protein